MQTRRIVAAAMAIAVVAFPASFSATSSPVWTSANVPLKGLSPAAAANPFPPASKFDPAPHSLSCASSSSCVEVETYAVDPWNTQGVIETRSSGKWTGITAPLGGLSPAASPSPDLFLNAVSCPSSTSCVAVGSYRTTSGNTQGLIETLAGGHWLATTAPLSGLSPPAGANRNASLFTVSCPAKGSCVAVGSYGDSSGHGQGLIETLAGGKWTATAAPLSGLNPSAGTWAFLLGLSCPASGWCVAFGEYTDSSGNGQGLIETLASGTWSATTAPLSGLSPAPGTNPSVFFRGALSCPAIGWCAAIGNYTGSSGTGQQGLIETLANGVWTARTAPLNGLTPPAATNGFPFFTDLSCHATGACVAVGAYSDTSGNAQGLIETLANGAWSATAAPLGGLSPSASGTGADLAGVSCPATGSCVAIGTYTDTSSTGQGLIETLASGTWTARTAPLTGLSPAPSAKPNVSFRVLSCPTTTSCFAFGKYADTSGNQQGVLETLAAPRHH